MHLLSETTRCARLCAGTIALTDTLLMVCIPTLHCAIYVNYSIKDEYEE